MAQLPQKTCDILACRLQRPVKWALSGGSHMFWFPRCSSCLHPWLPRLAFILPAAAPLNQCHTGDVGKQGKFALRYFSSPTCPTVWQVQCQSISHIVRGYLRRVAKRLQKARFAAPPPPPHSTSLLGSLHPLRALRTQQSKITP